MERTDAMSRARTRDLLLAGVADVRATLAAGCESEERAGTLSAPTVDALAEAGVLRMKLPCVLGGLEADPVTQIEVIEAVSAVNPSAGWCAMVGATSIGMPGAFLPDAGIARMFGEGVPRGAIVVMPSGEAQPVDGGYRLSGRWSFASGVRHAQWITAFCRVPRGAALAPEIRALVFPAADAEVHDNWHVTGLRGTGSCDISVTDTFVPMECSWNALESPQQRGRPLYRLGLPAFVANEHAAFALGLARRAIDTLVEMAASKRRGYAPGTATLAERGVVQHVIGRSEMQLRSARTLAIDLNERAFASVCGGATPAPRLQAELRAAATWCTEVAVEVVTRTFRYAGGSAIFETHALQRCLRDINVAAQHLVASDMSYEIVGRHALGFPDVNPMG